MGLLIPGLPDRHVYGNLASLEPDRVYTLVRQLHNARRAGLHTDVRIGSPGVGLLSFAAPKDLPLTSTDKRLLVRQPLHEWSYKDFIGTIGKGYGKGTVEKLELSPIAVLYNKPDKIKFTRADKRNAPVYTLVKTRNGNWIATVKTKDNPVEVQLYDKLHFKQISLQEAADMIDTGATATAKIDGAGALALIKSHGIDVYGINKDKYGNAIRYTDHIGGLRDMKIPPKLVGTVIRAEVAGEQNGRALKPQLIAGLLNNTLQHNILNRRNKGISLGLVALAVNKGKDIYDKARVDAVVKAVNNRKLISLPVISDRANLEKQLAMMRSGTHPMTQLGVVVTAPGQRPVKAKITDDADVIIQDVFPADVKNGVLRAGGFTYSLPGSDNIVGRVGSGIPHELLQDMLKDPQSYKGRTARIEVQQQYPSGAYRAPRFKSFRVLGD